jgi:ribonuclease HI
MADIPTIQSIYTDGACSGNPGPGGWGTVIYFDDGSVHEMGGSAAQTTNNRMEMQAAIAGLQLLIASGQTEPIELFTDSEYVKKGITTWIAGWKRKGWKTASNKPVLNQDLWQQLDQYNQAAKVQTGMPVQWTYVRGHAGNVGNERCDAIARAFSLSRRIDLTQIPAAVVLEEKYQHK